MTHFFIVTFLLLLLLLFLTLKMITIILLILILLLLKKNNTGKAWDRGIWFSNHFLWFHDESFHVPHWGLGLEYYMSIHQAQPQDSIKSFPNI